MENGKTPERPKAITIKGALEAFITDCETRNLNASTLSKYRSLQDNLSRFVEKRNLIDLAKLQTEDVRKFREERKVAPRTSGKELERLRAFFKFCVENEWLTKNPAKSIK